MSKTIEIELSPAELQHLQAASQSRGTHGLSRRAIIMGCVASCLIVAISVTPWLTGSDSPTPHPPSAAVQHARVAEAGEAAPTAPGPGPVRVQNPFDKREVFEFPAGTSQQAAHDAVAEMLLQRASERREQYPSLRKQKRKAS
jgi:hypothetical protein